MKSRTRLRVIDTNTNTNANTDTNTDTNRQIQIDKYRKFHLFDKRRTKIKKSINVRIITAHFLFLMYLTCIFLNIE